MAGWEDQRFAEISDFAENLARGEIIPPLSALLHLVRFPTTLASLKRLAKSRLGNQKVILEKMQLFKNNNQLRGCGHNYNDVSESESFRN